MSDHPVTRFLGVGPDAGPRALLGLDDVEPAALTRPIVEGALRDRLEQVYRHPAGRTDDAEAARRVIRAAAETLVRSMTARRTAPQRGAVTGGRRTPVAAVAGAVRRPGEPVRPGSARPAHALALTEFDRYALAILVGCGGWNAEARGRLVSLAGSYGITPDGLQKVVRGLSDYGRSGGRPLGVVEITHGAARLPVPTLPEASHTPVPVTELTPEEVEAEHTRSTIRMSLLFGVVTLVVGALIIKTALREHPGELPGEGVVTNAGPEGGTGAGGAPGDAPPETASPRGEALTLRTAPTFLGNALPPIATDAADQAPRVPQELDLIARKLSITDEPSDAIFRQWEAALDTVGSAWVLLDRSTLASVHEAVTDVFQETTDTPSVADRLLRALTPPRGRLGQPIDVWRGAHRAGLLGLVIAHGNLPAAVVERAREQLAIALGVSAADTPSSFEPAAAAWLDACAAGLIEVVEYEPRVFDYWEMWLSAERELPGDERRQAALIHAVRGVLRTPTDLARPGPSQSLLGRLLANVDFRTSTTVRDSMRALFDDQAIDDRDLWVMTSVIDKLDGAPWFTSELVLPQGGRPAFRGRVRDRIIASWPAIEEHDDQLASGRALMVDPAVAVRWRDLLARMDDAFARGPDDPDLLLGRVVLAARLNEAAGFIGARRTPEAIAVIDRIDSALLAPERASRGGASGSGGGGAGGGRIPPVAQPGRGGAGGRAPTTAGPRGQALGRDGVWAVAYEEARRSAEERISLLRSLRSQAGSDLGPIDAEAFVTVVYRGGPEEVRSLSHSIVVEMFDRGPNVAMELLDQHPGSPRTEEVAETLRAVTGRLLPAASSATYRERARLALVEHALVLRRGGVSGVDERASTLREVLSDRAMLVGRGAGLRSAPITPQEASQLLAEAWMERARMVIATTPVPADLAGLARRRATRSRLAEGPVQAMVAELLAVLDAITYVTVAEQPPAARGAEATLEAAAARRREKGHVFGQALEVELAIARIWALRMGVPLDGDDQEGEGR